MQFKETIKIVINKMPLTVRRFCKKLFLFFSKGLPESFEPRFTEQSSWFTARHDKGIYISLKTTKMNHINKQAFNQQVEQR